MIRVCRRILGVTAAAWIAAVSLAVVAAVATMAGCRGLGNSDGVLELRFGHVGQPGSLYEIATNEFARRVNERLDGRARVVVFGASQLGGDELLLQKLKLGTVEISLPSTVMSSMVDEFGLFELPYLVQDREHMRRIEEEVFWPRLAPLAEGQGWKILAVWENGFRHITNSVRPIVGPADLEDIKLRVPRGRWRLRMFQSYGANPSPMPFSEVFVALQTGVVDGQENPLAQIHSAQLQEVQRYLSLTGHVYSPAYVAVGTRRWSTLPEEIRTVVAETARGLQDYVYRQAEKLDEELLRALRDAGLEVNQADRQRFVAASEEIYGEFVAEVAAGEGLIAEVMALRRASAPTSGASSPSSPATRTVTEATPEAAANAVE